MENMMMSEAIGELSAALSAYQATASNPANSAKNPFLKNKYAPLNAILAEVRPELAKHGLALSQLVVGIDKIGVTTILTHKSGQYIGGTVSLTPDNSKGLSTAQNAGVVITYLRRYAVQSILGISGEDDTDGHAEKTTTTAKVEKVFTDDALSSAGQIFKSALDSLDKVAPPEAVESYRARGKELYGKGNAKRLEELAREIMADLAEPATQEELI